jgi:hypothetical protein
MEILILGPEERAKLKKIVDYAHKNPYTMDDLLDTINNPANAPGTKPEHQCEIPEGFKVVYSVDCLPEGKIRHLSICLNKKDTIPSVQSVERIMNACGFKEDLAECNIRFEKLEPGYTAVEIGELI